jgi:ElaB/YqjD/DUF883 family membrane-anchored ribosome-binding protein
MTTMTESATKAVKQYAEPALEALEENVRNAERAVEAGRRAVEDYTAEATLQVRRHPFIAVAVAVGVGTLFGCLAGFTLGRRGRALSTA